MKEQGGVKERIMSTACRLFYEQGYQATGINQIIEEAGIAKSSLYQHFASKELLLNEYLLTRQKEWLEDLHVFTAELPDGKKKLLALFDYRIDMLVRNNFKGCTFSRVVYELPNEGAVDLIRKHKNAIKTFITAQLLAIKKTCSATELEEMTDLIFNLSEGAILHSTLYNSPTPLENTKKIISKLLNTF